MIISDAIKYFARFPLKEGVIANFKGSALNDANYNALQTDINNLDPHSLIPDIKHFIAGQSEKKVFEIIKQVEGWFMLFEHSVLAISAPDNLQIRKTDMQFTVTIGFPLNKRGEDSFSEAIISDTGLALMFNLISLIKADDKLTCSQNRWLNNQIQLAPIEPDFLAGAIGWELQLHKDLNTLI